MRASIIVQDRETRNLRRITGEIEEWVGPGECIVLGHVGELLETHIRRLETIKRNNQATIAMHQRFDEFIANNHKRPRKPRKRVAHSKEH